MCRWLSNVRRGLVGEGNDASFFFMLLEIRSESCERESKEYRNIMLPLQVVQETATILPQSTIPAESINQARNCRETPFSPFPLETHLGMTPVLLPTPSSPFLEWWL